MPATIQMSCQSRKTAKNVSTSAQRGRVGGICHQDLVKIPNRGAEPYDSGRRVEAGRTSYEKESRMLGKLAGALIGRGSPAAIAASKGALLGAARPRWRGAASVRWRSALAAVGARRNCGAAATRAAPPILRTRLRLRCRRRAWLEIGLDRSLELDSHRLAEAVAAAAGGDADPAFRHAIFLDVGLFLPVEADPDAAAQQRLVEVRAARIERQAVGECRVELSSAMDAPLPRGA